MVTMTSRWSSRVMARGAAPAVWVVPKAHSQRKAISRLLIEASSFALLGAGSFLAG
jgi:hypothetical protein